MSLEHPSSAEGNTRNRLLAAAVELIAEDGIQAVSHRSTEERAGVSRGLTRYHFKTRECLLAAVLDYIAELDRALIQRVIEEHLGERPVGVMAPDANNRIAEQLARVFTQDRAQLVARFELYLYASRRPELAEPLARSRDVFVKLGAPYLAAAGAAHPEAAQRLLVASFNGLLIDSLIAPHPDYEKWGTEWMARLEVAAVQLGTTVPENPDVAETGRRRSLSSLTSSPPTGREP